MSCNSSIFPLPNPLPLAGEGNRLGAKRHHTKAGGFTYIGLLLFIIIMGISLAAVGEVWQLARQREKEQELLYIGSQFRRALNQYAQYAPGPGRRYPARLEDLLRDPRYPGVQRYLRKIYTDPITGNSDWGVIKSVDGGILGVYSLSEDKPLKKANFSKAEQNFEKAAKYKDWIFQAGVIQGPVTGVTGGNNVRK